MDLRILESVYNWPNPHKSHKTPIETLVVYVLELACFFKCNFAVPFLGAESWVGVNHVVGLESHCSLSLQDHFHMI